MQIFEGKSVFGGIDLLCADDIERIAVAGIPIGDDRDIDRVADAGQLLCHF